MYYYWVYYYLKKKCSINVEIMNSYKVKQELYHFSKVLSWGLCGILQWRYEVSNKTQYCFELSVLGSDHNHLCKISQILSPYLKAAEPKEWTGHTHIMVLHWRNTLIVSHNQVFRSGNESGGTKWGSCCSASQLCPTLWDPMDCSMPGLPVHHQLQEFAQMHVHWVGDAIQPSHPLSTPSTSALNPSQHQDLF